ncbi:MAG TPA: hypothetical protein VIN11_09020, partial [Roseivirga sp.]
IFNILMNNLKNPYVLKATHDEQDKHYRIVLSEQVTFLNKAQILKQLNKVPHGAEVYIDASKTVFIEHDVLEIINDFKDSAKYKNIQLKLSPLDHLELNGFNQSLGQVVLDRTDIDNMPLEKELKTIKNFTSKPSGNV